MHLWCSQVQCNFRPSTQWALLIEWRSFQGKFLPDVMTVKLVTFQIKLIEKQMIPQGSNCVPQLFSPTCFWKLRGVPQALWNHGFQHALLSATGCKACATGVVSANIWTQQYYLINWLWSDSLETDSGRHLHVQMFIRKCFGEIYLWRVKVLELSRERDWAAM